MNEPVIKTVFTLSGVLAGLSLLLGGTAAQAEWIDWWRTPEQQAEDALQSGDIPKLKSIAPNPLWEGVAEHKNGEFEAAAQRFDQEAIERQSAGQVQAANQALYNRGVSEVLNEQYDEAVRTFNQVLETDPQFDDAQHNRDVAVKLIQQQEQQEQQPQEGEGEGQDSGESSESDQQSSSPSESSDGDESSQDGETGEPQDSQDGSSGQESGQEEALQSAEADSEEQRRQDEQAAQAALEAEAQASGGEPAGESDGVDGEDNQQVAGLQAEERLSEGEQATEQWLRRIPDDPAGLLRRKLLQSHQLQYPEVRDAQQPW